MCKEIAAGNVSKKQVTCLLFSSRRKQMVGLPGGLHSSAHNIDIPSQCSTRPNTLTAHSGKAMQFINVVRSKPKGLSFIKWPPALSYVSLARSGFGILHLTRIQAPRIEAYSVQTPRLPPPFLWAPLGYKCKKLYLLKNSPIGLLVPQTSQNLKFNHMNQFTYPVDFLLLPVLKIMSYL